MQGAPSRAHDNRVCDLEVSGSLTDQQPNATALCFAWMKSAMLNLCPGTLTCPGSPAVAQMQWAQQYTRLPNYPHFPHVCFVSHSH